MLGINKIIFNRYNSITTIFFDSCIIRYNNWEKNIDKDKLFEILEKILLIIHNWDYEYINLKTIDGDDWSLDIYYNNIETRKYKGHGEYPVNFSQLDNLFININKEVL